MLPTGPIYAPCGAAYEYAPLALNHWKGCSHGCGYCFVPEATRTDKEAFHSNPTPRECLGDLAKQVKRMIGDPREILLSFTSDPYQPAEAEAEHTRRALEIILNPLLGLRCTVLTKGRFDLVMRDLPRLADFRDRFSLGYTLTFCDTEASRAEEPHAEVPWRRFAALREAHTLGIPTWVSLEPVINPDDTVRIVEATHSYVDHYKVGKLNHDPRDANIDWHEFRHRIVEVLEGYGFTRRKLPHEGEKRGTYYLKDALLKATLGE